MQVVTMMHGQGGRFQLVVPLTEGLPFLNDALDTLLQTSNTKHLEMYNKYTTITNIPLQSGKS